MSLARERLLERVVDEQARLVIEPYRGGWHAVLTQRPGLRPRAEGKGTTLGGAIRALVDRIETEGRTA